MRAAVKRGLTALGGRPVGGAGLLIYHRVGGGTPDERDLPLDAFRSQLDVLVQHDVVSLDEALARIGRQDRRPSTCLTFDDGFADVHDVVWPLLAERRLPFTVYLATAFVGGTMHWDGSTATAAGPGLSWAQLETMLASGLCTIGNHTHSHCRPERLTVDELDTCSDTVEAYLGVRPRHFAWTWGVPVPSLASQVRQRFDSAVTGRVGRAGPGADLWDLPRLPVRRTDPLPYVRSMVEGRLRPAVAYDRTVRLAKQLGAHA